MGCDKAVIEALEACAKVLRPAIAAARLHVPKMDGLKAEMLEAFLQASAALRDQGKA